MRRNILIVGAALSALGAIAPATTALAQSRTFVNVVDSTEGYLPFDFNPPQVNDGRTVLFQASTATNSGWFTRPATGGPVTTIADAAGGFAPRGVFPSINNSGTVAFRADKGSDAAIFSGIDGATVIANAPFPHSGQFYTFGTSGIVSINDGGTVAFWGATNAGGLGHAGGSGIFAGNGGSITTIADTYGGAFANFGSATDINSSGMAAFTGTTATHLGVYRGDGGTVTPIYESSDSDIRPLNAVAINDAGATAFFVADIGGGDDHLYVGDGTALSSVADTGGAYQQFTDAPDINNAGDIIFNALLDDGRRGIFDGPDPAADKIIASGDTLFGSTVTDVEFYRGLNNQGDVAFLYRLANGVSGIALSQVGAIVPPPPPPPAAVPLPTALWNGLAMLSGLGLWMRRRRFKAMR